MTRGALLSGSLTVLLAAAAPALAQQGAPAPLPPPAADPRDVSSVDAIMLAVYDVISGDSGQARDWNRFRSLFAPGARLVPLGARAQGGYSARVLTVEEYIAAASPFMTRQGFHEREVARRQETYGPMVHLFSTYESRHRRSDATPFARGINSFQLYSDGQRWWVLTIFWHGETQQTPVPARYLATEIH